MRKLVAAAVFGATVVAAVVALGPAPAPPPVTMKYRADEFGRTATIRDAGRLVGRESPCFREAWGRPECIELRRQFPDGGAP
jgi:hypothetical protein